MIQVIQELVQQHIRRMLQRMHQNLHLHTEHHRKPEVYPTEDLNIRSDVDGLLLWRIERRVEFAAQGFTHPCLDAYCAKVSIDQ